MDFMPLDMQGSTKTNTNDSAMPVRGALDEKHEINSKAVALEEGADDDDPDLEAGTSPRPILRVHSFKISLAVHSSRACRGAETVLQRKRNWLYC